MKMKSKFFGFNAKLALALLAVIGLTFTSCYESDKEDVNFPVTPLPDPVYTIVGQVTDALTGRAISGASVALSGVDAQTTSTDTQGNYQFILQGKAGAAKLDFSASEYDNNSASFTIVELQKGQSATYFKSIALVPQFFEPEAYTLSLENDIAIDDEVIYEGEKSSEHYNPAADIINTGNKTQKVSFKFAVEKGAILTYDDLDLGIMSRSASEGLKEAVLADLRKLHGNITAEFSVEDIYYTAELWPDYAIKKVTLDKEFNEYTYLIKYGTDRYTIKVKKAENTSFAYDQVPLHFYHGHGHGGDLNHGGGIVVPLN